MKRNVLLTLVIAAASLTCLLAAVTGTAHFQRLGGWAVSDVLVIAWARQFPDATLVLYGCANAAFGQWVRPHLYGFNVTSEYWTLQWIESLIYVTLALALGYASLWWMRRRYS